jgi:hypothetical protein
VTTMGIFTNGKLHDWGDPLWTVRLCVSSP